MIEVLGFILFGCFAGAFTGLVPGIHTNTIALIAVSFAASAGFGVPLVMMIVSMSVVHSFVSFVPSIALGAPDEDSFISVLPGHRFLLKGLGLHAIKLTAIGGLFACIISIAMLPLFAMFVLKTVHVIYPAMPAIIIIVFALMLHDEKGTTQRKWALYVILLSGSLGLAGLRAGIFGNAIFPLVTGFFGASTLIYSMNKNTGMPAQEFMAKKYRRHTVLTGSALGVIAGALVSLLPSLGPNQAAFILRKIIGKMGTSQYLIVIGGISTVNAIFAFFVLYLAGKARTGTAAAVAELVELSAGDLMLIVATVLLAAGFGVVATEILGKFTLTHISKLPYKIINILVLGMLALLVAGLSGAMGFLLFLTSTGIGLTALTSGVKRTNCMAFLMVPTLAFYIGI
ncbi:tripartite tricarboxylate transporter permease [Candidatus Micrarchaeota archaeon]|nr:tripartite tricarboxylate transporter permease [Candidatus Micrarchaeota archaeon]MBU1939229.1 tripartite tricarboxylate transporter permease [Candidatus Micrarchaeota archaeon]